MSLSRFSSFWHRELIGGKVLPQLDGKLKVKVPEALLAWHRLLPEQNKWCERAEILGIERLQMENDRLIIRTESVFNGMLTAKWGIATESLALPDPPVVCILGDREYHCADKTSHFAIYCALFDTVNSHLLEEVPPENDYPFPADGHRANFPGSFGIIETEIYEGENWLALVSGNDWYLRLRMSDGTDRFVKHEVRDNPSSTD